MKLRKLAIKDAPMMLEWMHDRSVVAHLGANFAEKKVEDCLRFIEGSLNDSYNLHLAVTNENDEYMGTVSLKHIDNEKKFAEFAITVRTAAMGKGYAQYAMRTILEYGKNNMRMDSIYWCVSPNNVRAVRFYDKCGYQLAKEVPNELLSNYSQEQLQLLVWYVYPSCS